MELCLLGPLSRSRTALLTKTMWGLVRGTCLTDLKGINMSAGLCKQIYHAFVPPAACTKPALPS